MSTLHAIIIAALAGGALSTLFASFSLAFPISAVQRMVALAVGTMLAAVFLDVLPHGLEMAGGRTILLWVLIGILFFFLLEKLVIWRHSHPHGHGDEGAFAAHTSVHGHAAHAHDHAHTHAGHHVHARPATERTGLMIVLGSVFHNLSDGVLIAGAFLADFKVGLATTVAIVVHAIPQEMGDFIVLRNAGWSRSKALAINLGATIATIAGALLGYFALSSIQGAIPAALGFAAASMLYIAVADLIPHLHQRPRARDIVEQLALIGLGVAMIVGLHEVVEALHLAH